MIEVLDGKMMYAELEEDEITAWNRFVVAKKRAAIRVGVRLLPPTMVSSEPPLLAEVHWNRWIVRCPDCPQAEMVWKSFQVMICHNCWNGRRAHQWRRIAFPDNYLEIEAILKLRPIPENRNWTNESIQDLINENAAHEIVR